MSTYELDADNAFIDQLDSYDDHEQVMLELAEMGDNSLWARGDVMLHIVPPDMIQEGQPPDRDTKNTISSLAHAGRMARSHANDVYRTSEYYERRTVVRTTVLSMAKISWSFANLARRKVPGGVTKALKELKLANDEGMSFATFKAHLRDKYPTNGNEPDGVSVRVNPDQFSLVHGDMLEVLEDYDAETVDLVIADPPYNVTDWDWDQRGTPEAFVKESRQWLKAVQRVLKKDHHLFWFCSPRFSADIEFLFRELSMPIKSHIVWHRRNMPLGSDATDQFIDTWEMILHSGQGKLHWAQNGDWSEERFDVQTFAVPQSNYKDFKWHPTPKPLGLVKRLVEFGSTLGSVVLDPFAGGGTTGHACHLVGSRYCTLIEKEDEYIAAIKKRLKGL